VAGFGRHPVRSHVMKITIQTTIAAPLDDVWRAWTTPADIERWNAASDDWHTTAASVDLRSGGTFSSRMEAKDGSAGFDFTGTYTRVDPHVAIEYVLDDGRFVAVEFREEDGAVRVTETFDAESRQTAELEREGWQAILDNFARYVESNR
jgi:uncharacterized protein YndB with AHSA1/START domain